MEKNDLEFIYREILEMIQELCHIDFHDLHDFIVNNDNDREYRLSGKYGFGFKLWKRDNYFQFTQYQEDETKESVKWIKLNNDYLKRLCIETCDQ